MMSGEIVRRRARRRDSSVAILAVALAVIVGGLTARLPPAFVACLIALVAAAIVVIGAFPFQRRLLAVIGAVCFVVAFQWTYVAWVVPLYAYSGLIDAGVGAAPMAAVSVLALIPVAWLPIRAERPSDIVLWFLYLFGYVPASIVPIYILGPDQTAVFPFAIVLLIGFALVGLMQQLPRAVFRRPGLSERSFERVALAIGLAALLGLIALFGVPTSVPDFVSAYDVRSSFAAAQAGVPGSGYFVEWAGNVIFPLLISLGLNRRHLPLLCIGVIGAFLIYTQAGAKAVLFNIALVPLLYLALRWFNRGFAVGLMWGSVGLLAASVVLAATATTLWPIALFAVRLLALPGELTAYYLEFFTSHATYELSGSILRWLIESPYPVDPPQLIGALYFHGPVNANANMWADAIANFGLLGVVPFSMLLGVIMWVLDSVAVDRDLLVLGPTLGITGLSLADGALLTSILTFGIGLTIVVAIAMPSQARNPRDGPRSWPVPWAR